MRILVIQLYRLGDVLQTTPVLQALKKKYGHVTIDFVVDETCAFVVRDNPYISRLFVLPRKSARLAGGKDFLTGFREIAAFFGELKGTKYDLAINYNFDAVGGILLKLCDAAEKRGLLYESGRLEPLDTWTKYLFAIVEARKYSRINISDVFKFIAGCGGIASSLYLKSGLNSGVTKTRFLNFERQAPVVAVQGFGSKMFKSLSPGKNEELIRILIKDHNVVLLGAKGEEDHLAHMKDSGVFRNMTAKTSLEELVSIIKNSDLLVSPDTFAVHAAAALGTKVVAYFLAGVTPYETAPYAEGPWIIHREAECSPCDFPDRCKEHKCAKNITPQLLAGAAASAVSGTKPDAEGPGLKVLKPHRGEFLYFDSQHMEFIEEFIKIMDLTGRGKQPIIPVKRDLREGTGALLAALDRLKRDLAKQTA
jgi:ADP-heptose:LPS heptosyltransferase